MFSKPLLFLSSVFLFLVFIYFSYHVAKQDFQRLDFDTTVKIQDHIARKFDLSFSTLSLIGTAEVTGLFWLGLVVFVLIRKMWLTALGLALFLVIIPIELFGKVFVFHPGPPFLFFRGIVSINFPSQYLHTDYSYPSGHMSRVSFLVSFLIIYISSQLKSSSKILFQLGLILFLVLMAVSRIYLGEHWASDVIGGTLIGSSLGILASLMIPSSKTLTGTSNYSE